QKEEFNQLETLVKNTSIDNSKTEIVEIDREIAMLNRQYKGLQMIDKRLLFKDFHDKPTSTSDSLVEKLYDPTKATKWKPLKVAETLTINPLEDKNIEKLLKECDSKESLDE